MTFATSEEGVGVVTGRYSYGRRTKVFGGRPGSTYVRAGITRARRLPDRTAMAAVKTLF